MHPKQDQGNNTEIKQHRAGRVTDKPSQPHVTGPTEGFISNPEGSDSDGNEKKASYSRSDLQASGMQPSEEFLKEQQVNQDVSKELNQIAKKKPRLVMTLIVVGAILIAVAGIVLAFSLIS